MITKVKNLLKKNRILHFWVTYYRDKDFRRSYQNYLKPNPFKKTRKIVRRELEMIRNYWGCPPYHYYLYNLYEQKLSDDQLLDYIAPFYYYNIYWEKRHLGLKQSRYWSKYFQYQLFKKFDIPTMDIIAMIRNGALLNMQNKYMSFNELVEKYLTNGNNALFLKPEYGRGGKGIVLLSKKDDKVFLNNEPISIEKIISRLSSNENYIIQERFVQSHKMTEINRHSVNTLRIGTRLNNDEITVSFCMLRMGTNNSFVDNMSSGGIIIIVDTNDGTLADYAQSPDAKRKYYMHPNSQYVFKNGRIENWHEIKSQIIKYAYLLHECKDLGWDVAISDTGIKILEINIYFALDQQPAYNGMRKILNVYPELLKMNS
jgi:hypothetical protein